MDEKLTNFVMRLTREMVISRYLSNVVLIFAVVISIFLIPFPWNPGFGFNDLIVYVVFFVVGSAFSIVRSRFWKVTVSGEQIHERTLLTRREYTFQDFRVVEIKDAGDAKSILLKQHNNADPFLKVHVGCTGYNEFVARLKENNIPGSQSL